MASNIQRSLLEKMAPRVGFEPTAIRLTVECSTTELSGNNVAYRETSFDVKRAYSNAIYRPQAIKRQIVPWRCDHPAHALDRTAW